MVNVSAYNDIGLTKPSGDMLIGQIASTAGSVAITVQNGNIYDSLSQTSASSLSTSQVNAIAAALNLNGATDAEAGAAAVTSFEKSVNSSLAGYGVFLAKGTIVAANSITLDSTTLGLYSPLANSAAIQSQRANQTGGSSYASLTNAQVQANANALATTNGVFQITITSSNRSNYQAQAAQALGIADASTVTDTQIQGWANAQYQTYAATFTQAYGSGWAARVTTDSVRLATVNTDLPGYKNLIAAGAVTNGVFTLASGSVETYRNQTALALNIDDASKVTTAQIQTFAGGLYQTYASDLSGAFGSSWQTVAQSTSTYAPFSVTAGSALATSLTSSSRWTAQQLVQAIDSSALQPASSVVGNDARADIIGQNVSLTVQGGSIGTYNPAGLRLSFQHLTNETLSTSELAALATATAPGSVTLIGTSPTGSALPAGTGLATLAPGSTVSAIQIAQTKPVFVNATGALTVNASSTVYLQGTSGSSFNVNRVQAGGDVSIAAPASITTATLAGIPLSATQFITPGNLSLVAGTGGIGSSTTPIVTQIGGAYVNISAPADVYLRSVGADMRLDRVFAGGTASLGTATGYSIVSALAGVNVQGGDIVLSSGNAIGTGTTPLAVRTTGTLSGSAVGAANIYGSPIGGGQNNDLTVTSFTAGGALKIGAQGTFTLNNTLSSVSDGVSVTAGSFIMAATSTISVGGVVSINTLYDATLASLSSTAVSVGGAATVSVNAGGAILLASGGPTTTITTGANGVTSLVATNDIGAATAPIAIDTPTLFANSTSGSVYVAGRSPLHVTSINAGAGRLLLTGTGALTVDLASSFGRLDITSAGGAVALGTANSGGAQTVEAKNALTYNTLKTTAGDIKLTSDTASVKGVTVGGVADTLEAKNAFDIAAATDVSATSLKSDTTSGSIRSTGGSVTVATTNTTTSLNVNATGAVGLTTVTTGTTFDATSSGSTVALGTANSGGAQTVEAKNALTYNTLKTTAGDIKLTSDAASVKGVTVGTTADTLEAQNAFDIAAATDVASNSLKSDTGSGSIRSTGGAVMVATTNAATSLGVNATGAVGMTNVTTGTTFDATSSGSTVALGTANSGGTQTIEAKNALTYNTLKTTAGDIKLTSDTASIAGIAPGDALDAKGAFNLAAATTINGTSLKSELGSGTVKTAGAINLGTANTATTLDVTSTGDAIALGTATSGGTQTVEAKNALTYNTLKTTVGDIKLTSDTASVKGVSVGTTADTLGAKNAFQIAAATDVSATSLKSDTGSGSIRSSGGAVTVATTNAATSLGVNATGAIGLTNVTTGTTFDATSSGSTVALGTVTSGGAQTIEAKNALTYNTLKTTVGDIKLTSDTASVKGIANGNTADTLEAQNAFNIAAATDVVATSLKSDTGAGSVRSTGGDVTVATTNTTTSLGVNATGAIGLTTVTTGTTFDATSSGSTVALGTANSGGTQTVEAKNALTYNTLKTTVGDIKLTSDTASVKGITNGNTADTLEAQNTFQIAAATDVVAVSLKSDTGAGSVRSTGGDVTVATTNTTTSLGVNATGAIGLTIVTTGTTFDATSSGSTIALGTATSGGTQTVRARDDIAFTTLRTTGISGDPGDVTLASTNGSLLGGDIFAAGSISAQGKNIGFGTFNAGHDATLVASGDLTGTNLTATDRASLSAGGALSVASIKARDLALTSPGSLSVGTLDVGSSLNLAASSVSVGTVNSPGTLSLTLTGFNGGIGTSANLYVNAPSIVIPSLRFADTSLSTSASFVGVQNATVPGTLRLASPYSNVLVNDRSSLPRPGSTVQLFQPGQNFFLYQSGNTTYTNAYVVQFARSAVVNGDIAGGQNSNPSFINDLPRYSYEGNDRLFPSMLPGDALSRWMLPMAAFTDYLQRLNSVTPPTTPSAAVNLEESETGYSFVPGTLLIVPSRSGQRP